MLQMSTFTTIRIDVYSNDNFRAVLNLMTCIEIFRNIKLPYLMIIYSDLKFLPREDQATQLNTTGED